MKEIIIFTDFSLMTSVHKNSKLLRFQ